MRLDFGLDLVVLIFEKNSLGVFVSSHLSHFIIEMSHRKLEISFCSQNEQNYAYVCLSELCESVFC